MVEVVEAVEVVEVELVGATEDVVMLKVGGSAVLDANVVGKEADLPADNVKVDVGVAEDTLLLLEEDGREEAYPLLEEEEEEEDNEEDETTACLLKLVFNSATC